MNDKTLTRFAVRDIMLFIAELNGYKAGTLKAKYTYGMQCYMSNTFPTADLDTEKGRKDLHKILWLERIYDKLDSMSASPLLSLLKRKGDAKSILRKLNLKQDWDIPIELDASASMLGYIGALLGDERLLTETNMHGTALNDPWNRGMDRTKFKHAATPMLYGSSKACHDLWAKKRHTYTMDDVTAFNKELTVGSLGLANKFKDFLINNCTPKAEMTIKLAGQQFSIVCNRYRNVGEITKRYSLYDTITNSVRTVCHTDTKRVPDLDKFRRYFVTLLVHNLDSMVADNVVKAVIAKYGWALDIHDAFLVHPSAARTTRLEYAKQMQAIYDNREVILQEYFDSIGITAAAAAKWKAIQTKIKPVTNFKCRTTVLK